MANNLLTDDIIVKDALRLLKNNTVMAPLVYREYEKKFGKVGDTINLELPFRTKSAEGPVLVPQPMVDQSTTLTINRHRHTSLDFGMKDRRLSIQMFSERYLKSGVVKLANDVDASICATLKAAFLSSGVPGTTPGSYAAFANAGAKLTSYAVPQDMRRAVVNPITCAVLSNEIKGLFESSMVKESYVAGYKGKVADFTLHETQNLPKHTVGPLGGTPLVNGTSQTGSSLVTDGWTAAAANRLKAGDVFTIDGVYGVNPQTYESTGYLQEFVVTADADSDVGGNATISISPAINDGSLTTTNPSGQTVSLAAYQNVSNAPADNAAITVIGSANTQYDQNYLFHKEAIALAMIDFEIPETAKVAQRARDPQTGMSMLMTGGFDMQNFRSVYRLDIMWGTKAIYPELALRLWGAAIS